jgi:hypothetical protein
MRYLWGTTWKIKLNRFRAPLLGVIGFPPLTFHVVTPHSVGALKSAQNQPPIKQKAVEFVMFWWRKIQTTFYGLTIWSVMPETVPYAIARPLPDGDTKQLLKFKIRLSLLFGFPINQDNDRIKPGILIT